jgi:hypothetical protein
MCSREVLFWASTGMLFLAERARRNACSICMQANYFVLCCIHVCFIFSTVCHAVAPVSSLPFPFFSLNRTAHKRCAQSGSCVCLPLCVFAPPSRPSFLFLLCQCVLLCYVYVVCVAYLFCLEWSCVCFCVCLKLSVTISLHFLPALPLFGLSLCSVLLLFFVLFVPHLVIPGLYCSLRVKHS